MKRIFKKIRNQDSNRSHRITPTSSSSPLTAINTPEAPSSTCVTYSNRHSDYFTSEEEFQVQLALAISASNSESRDKDPIDALERGGIRIKADSLSRRYWDYNVLDYDEKVIDGFYDLYGLSMDPASQVNMPSLADLQTTCVDHGFEVIIVNRTIDPALEELHQIAQCIANDSDTTDTPLLVQRLANLVTEHLGGPVMDANIMQAMWMEKSMELRTSLHQSILPLGSLNIGLSRHRSLLFKVLADNVGIPCRLVKGSHYTGNDDDAVNIIKLENEREFLVDLMADPGTLIPSEILNTKGDSINSCSTRINEIPRLQSDGSLVIDRSSRNIVCNLGNEKSLVENYIPKYENSGHEIIESVTPGSIRSSGELPTSICNSTKNSIFLDHSPGNQSHPSSSSVLESYSQLKEKQGHLNLAVVKENHNVVPPSPDSTKELENLFADLNPFQMVGSGRTSIQTIHINNKAKDLQKKWENIDSDHGRPPSPLVWKNHTTCNDVPSTKQYDFVVGLLPRKNQEVKNYNASSMASTNSYSSDKNPEFYNVSGDTSCVSYPGNTNISVGHPSAGGGLISTLSLDQCTSPEKDGYQTNKVHHVIQSPVKNFQSQYYRDQEVSQKDTKTNSKKLEKSNSDKHDHRNNKYERNINAEVTLGSQVDAGPSRLDTMLEDVAEWEIPWEDLVVSERIGIGSYGEVFRADWKGTEVAVKKFLDQDFLGDSLDEFRSEVRIMRKFRHPNVVLFLGAVTRPPNLSIITEFLPRGSLYRILHRPNNPIDERRRIEMALDVAQGMNCLHTSVPTVVHRDLKSPNLLVDDNWNVKVCDFGLSRLKHNTFLSSKSTAGTPEWMAPEVLRNENSNEKCDVYSFGVILWELATLRKPWIGLNPMQVVGVVGFQNRRLEIPEEVDPLVAKIIQACWQTDPNLRPSFAQLTATLRPLQQLVISSHQEQHGLHL